MSLQLTSITQTPDRLASKGAEFLRRNNANTGIFARRRKSAVELLEASKSEYVKSVSVLNHKQELKHPEVLHIGNQSNSNIPSNCPVRPVSEYGTGRDSLDHIGDTSAPHISVERTDGKCVQKKNSNSSVHSGSSKRVRLVSGDGGRLGQSSPEAGRIGPKEHDNVSPVLSENQKIKVCASLSNSSDIKHKDHGVNMDSAVKEKPKLPEKPKIPERPKLPEKPKIPERPKPPVRSKDFLVPTSYQSLSTSVTVLVEKRCSNPTKKGSENEHGIVRRKKTLHRSQSDLSCRHSRTSSDMSDLSSRRSRTSTDLERFFDEMGIDRTVLDPMLRLHHRTQAHELQSMSSIASAPNDRSSCSDASQGGEMSETDKKIAECNSKQTSIVETNARIIKWLCNVNKAQKPNQQSSS